MSAIPSTVAQNQANQSAVAGSVPFKIRRSLFDIGEDFLALDDLLDEHLEANDGEITDIESIIDGWLAEFNQDLLAKADGYAAYVKELDARAKARREEAARLAKRASVDENTMAHLKTRLKEFMEFRGQKKLQTRRYAISVAGNGGLHPLHVRESDPARLPVEFQKVIVTADNDKIRKALASSDQDTVLKAAAVAELLPRGTHLRIS